MTVLVFGYNPKDGRIDPREFKKDILKQLNDNTALLFIDNRVELKGVIELTEKDCKQFGVALGHIGERGNH